MRLTSNVAGEKVLANASLQNRSLLKGVIVAELAILVLIGAVGVVLASVLLQR